MVELRLDEIARRMGGAVLQGDSGRLYRSFNLDSRLTSPGDLFFAVPAARDGHDFVDDARRRGAGGAVVSREVSVADASFGLVRVRDTVEALQRLAAETLRVRRVGVVGITGSAGKTTTKEFAAELLGARFRVLKSTGNYNNHLGLALSLLNLEARHDLAVLEMAMSGPGEILLLTRVAPPDVAVITNVHPVHLAFFKSLEDIAAAKAEILDGLKPGGTAVLNGDDPLLRKTAETWTGRIVRFGLSDGCDVRAENIGFRGFEGLEFVLRVGGITLPVSLPFYADAFVLNFLAAVGAALALGLTPEEIQPRFGLLKPLHGRGSLVRLAGGIVLVDESYNSNPRALESALRGAARFQAERRVAVLGDMLELGPAEAEFHRRSGRLAAELGFGLLVTVGSLARLMAEGASEAGLDRSRIFSYPDAGEAAAGLPAILRGGDLVLVKGSRGVHLDHVVNGLKNGIKET
ncbi:MAG: UDP-N-acetylmuramoyl-tripeptide--D-alanyl-D-alanine ligase [Candidatus Aminicenantes bacterium]|nr:UDP-N-acetylmuramoyl-tripeptide--D-alanyl-D-alanine ligase [Candidatus Aminicenantes bacterium]